MQSARHRDRGGDEDGRLAALARYDVLDTAAEPQFDRITALICSGLNVPMAAVSLVDRERQWFKSRQNIALEETERKIAFCDHTIRTPNVMIVCDARLDPRFCSNPLVTGAPHLLSYAGVPLQTPDGYNIGTLCALDNRARAFSSGDIETLANLAAIAVDALEMRMIANFDHLTGAFTRRAFLSQLDLAINRRGVRGNLATLMLIDLDHFKVVNDTYGHAAGDGVLTRVAQICRKSLRENDVFGRIGGEEFGLLLCGTGIDEAMAIAERLRAAIATSDIAGLPGLRVTASFGVAQTAPGMSSTADWLAKADALLYVAKSNGRNRCERFDPADMPPLRAISGACVTMESGPLATE